MILRSIALIGILTLALSGCSTACVQNNLVTPPESAMALAQPLPKLQVSPALKDSDKTSIGLKEIVEDDLQLSQMYQDLAIRHNALVKYVESVMKSQSAPQ